MPDVARRPSVIKTQVVWIGGKRTDAIGVAIRFCQHVVRVHRSVAVETAVEIKDELILVVTSARVVFEDVATRRRIDVGWNKIGAIQRSDAAVNHTRNERAGQRRVKWPGTQHVQRTNVDVARRNREILWQ